MCAEKSSMAPDLLKLVVITMSCIAFCLVMLMLVVILYRKKPLCCRFTPQSTQHYTDDSPHSHSRHSLISISHIQRAPPFYQRTNGPQLAGGLFIIGKPSDYHLDGPPPRLPSYESVRKQDRQKEIHSMIARRFGLSGSRDESPPSYEEAFHHSQEVSPVDVASLDTSLFVHTQCDSSDLSENSHFHNRTSTASS